MTTLTDVQLARIFGEVVDSLHIYPAEQVKAYALRNGHCRIDGYLLARCRHYTQQSLDSSCKHEIRKRFQSYLRNVLGLDGDEMTQSQSTVTPAPVTDSAPNVTGAVYKAYLKRSVLNRGRPFPTYEKARQYIRRHITAHIGADNYNDDQRITMPVDDINRNYPNITALGYAIKKAA